MDSSKAHWDESFKKLWLHSGSRRNAFRDQERSTKGGLVRQSPRSASAWRSPHTSGEPFKNFAKNLIKPCNILIILMETLPLFIFLYCFRFFANPYRKFQDNVERLIPKEFTGNLLKSDIANKLWSLVSKGDASEWDAEPLSAKV